MKKGYEKPGHKWIKRIPTPSGAYKYIYNKLDVNKDRKINKGDLDTYIRRQEIKKKVSDVQKYGRVLTDKERRKREKEQKEHQKYIDTGGFDASKFWSEYYQSEDYKRNAPDVSEQAIMKRVIELRKRKMRESLEDAERQRLDRIHKRGVKQRLSHVKEEQTTRRRKEKNRKKKMNGFIDLLIGNK